MATITEAIQHLIKEQSQRIHDIKQAALVTESVERYAYVSPDGTSLSDRRPAESELAAGWKLQKVTREKVIGHISPKHAQWTVYQASRRRASLLLTARLLLKLGGGNVPDINTVRDALREGKLSHHARRGRAQATCFAAYRYLRKISNRLNRFPERFTAADAWVQERRLRRAKLSPEEEVYA